MASFLLIRPNYDGFTRVAYRWGEDIRDALADNLHHCVDLSGGNAQRSNIKACLQPKPIDCVLFYGHGLEDRLLAQPHPIRVFLSSLGLLANPLRSPAAFDTNDVHLLSASGVLPKLIYAVACYSAVQLGEVIHQQGIIYIGYSREIVTIDPYESYFRQAVNAAILHILSQPLRTHKSCEAVLMHAHREYDRLIGQLETSWDTVLLEESVHVSRTPLGRLRFLASTLMSSTRPSNQADVFLAAGWLEEMKDSLQLLTTTKGITL